MHDPIDDFRKEVEAMSDKDLKRHYRVSWENRHKCRACFCCACGEELARRKVKDLAESVVNQLERMDNHETAKN